MNEAPSSPELDHEVTLFKHAYHIREVTPEDESALETMFSRASPEDIRLRCLGAIKNFPHLAAARLARADTRHEVALIALDVEQQNEPVGVVHIIDEPSVPGTAEFDVMVRTDMKGRGVGFQLIPAVVSRARARNLKTIEGYILYENRAMLQMTRELGFHATFDGADVVRVSLDL